MRNEMNCERCERLEQVILNIERDIISTSNLYSIISSNHLKRDRLEDARVFVSKSEGILEIGQLLEWYLKDNNLEDLMQF